jgi:hypothetical protein
MSSAHQKTVRPIFCPTEDRELFGAMTDVYRPTLHCTAQALPVVKVGCNGQELTILPKAALLCANNHFLRRLAMMQASLISCPSCKRNGFKSRRALSQHWQRSPACIASIHTPTQSSVKTLTTPGFLNCVSLQSCQNKHRNAIIDGHDAQMLPSSCPTARETGADCNNFDFSEVNEELGYIAEVDSNDEDFQLVEYGPLLGPDYDGRSYWTRRHAYETKVSVLEGFREYTSKRSNFFPFAQDEIDAINLLFTLRKTKAPLCLYESIMAWHHKTNGDMQKHERLGQNKHYISREKIFRKLAKRYNMDRFSSKKRF